MSEEDIVDLDALKLELKQLREQHRQLDTEIHALRETGAVDMLKTGRMKKIKLKLKDRIAALEDSLTPDIIA